MTDMRYEPFGEPLARDVGLAGSNTRRDSVRRGALRVGVGAFWLLAAAIVVARAIYFDPNFAETFMRVASLSK